MRLWTHRAVRALAASLVVAIAASGCARPDDAATLTEATASTETAGALEALAATAGADPLPTPSTPILLGLDDPGDQLGSLDDPGGRLPESLVFELEIPQYPATTSAEGPEAAGETADAAGEPPAVDGDATGEDDGTTPVGDDGESENTGDEVEDEQLPLPPPPPAARPGTPAYDDPSATIVAASGRAFDLFDIAGGGAVTTRGLSDDVILVGGLATRTLAGNPYRDAVCDGAQARFEQANSHRELTRRVEIIDCYDDTGRDDISGGLAQSLVRQDAFALVPLATPTFFEETTLNGQTVLYVGDERLPGFCGRTNPLGFAIRGAAGCPVLDARGYVTLVEPVMSAYAAAVSLDGGEPWSGLTYVVSDSPQGEVTAASRLFEAELLGAPAPDVLAILPTAGDGPAPNWTAIVDAILGTDPRVVVLDGPAVDGLPAALRESGFTGELVLVGVVDPLDVAVTERRLELAPLLVISPGIDLATRTSSGWTAIVGAAAAIGMPESDIGTDFVSGYLAADFFVRAIGATPEPLSVEAVANTVNTGWWYPGVDGVGCGSWWPAGHYIVAPCVSVSRVEVFSAGLVPVLGLVETAPQVAFDLVAE